MNVLNINNLLIKKGIVKKIYPSIQYVKASNGKMILGFYPSRYNKNAETFLREYFSSVGFTVEVVA